MSIINKYVGLEL